jgi:hypothetical protein
MSVTTALVRRSLILVTPALIVVAGCSSRSDIHDRFDPPSLVRLNAIPDGGTVVVSCRLQEVPGRLTLGDEATELARTGSSILVQIPKAKLADLGKLPGVQLASVWGEAKSIQKLDPRLLPTLLGAWENPSPNRLSLLVRFAPGTDGAREKLEAQGVGVRTVAGAVVTVDADPEAVLRMLDIPEIQSVFAPRELAPNGG